MTDKPPDHEHVWVYLRSDDDWYDGDSEDVYGCTVEGCQARDYRYVPR